jgi:hypothetical protein
LKGVFMVVTPLGYSSPAATSPLAPPAAQSTLSRVAGDVFGAAKHGAKEGVALIAGRELVALMSEVIPGFGPDSPIPEEGQVILAATACKSLAATGILGEFGDTVEEVADHCIAAAVSRLVGNLRPGFVEGLRSMAASRVRQLRAVTVV